MTTYIHATNVTGGHRVLDLTLLRELCKRIGNKLLQNLEKYTGDIRKIDRMKVKLLLLELIDREIISINN